MSTAGEELDRLVSTTIQAWARLYGAWLQALNDIWLSIQDLAPSETDVLASNQTDVYISAQPTATSLVMSKLTGGPEDATIDSGYITLSPSDVAAGTDAMVVVTVTPPANALSGMYEGAVLSANGAALAPVYIYVSAASE